MPQELVDVAAVAFLLWMVHENTATQVSLISPGLDTDCMYLGPQYNPIPYAAAGGAANQLFPPTTPAGAWGMETVLTFALVFMVLSATDSERAVDAPHLPVRPAFVRQTAGMYCLNQATDIADRKRLHLLVRACIYVTWDDWKPVLSSSHNARHNLLTQFLCNRFSRPWQSG